MSAPDPQVQHGENQAAIIKLGGRVDNLESAIGGVKASLDGIAKKLDERGHVNWQVILSAIAGIAAFGYFVYGAQTASYKEMQTSLLAGMHDIATTSHAEVEKLATTLDHVNGRFEQFVTAPVLDNRFKAVDELRDAKADKQNTAVADLKVDVEAIKGRLVPRPEHEEHWHSFDLRFQDQQRQIDANTSILREMYSAKDALAGLLAWKSQVEARGRVP